MSLKNFLHKLNRRDTCLLPKFTLSTKIIFILVFITGSVFFLRQILAADDLEEYQKINTESRELWLQGASNDSIFDWINKLAGRFRIENGKFKVTLTDLLTENNTAFLGVSSQAIASLYTPQASGVEYIASSWNNFIGGKTAYAAQYNGYGIGYNGLQPILKIWRNFRDFFYLISAFIFIILGFMVILRVKVSPTAVITIQSAIPRLIITLILVTFSYAIAGLLIDLSYVIQGLAISIMFPNLAENSIYTQSLSTLSSFLSKINVSGIPLIGGMLQQLFNFVEGIVVSKENLIDPGMSMTTMLLAIPTVTTVLLASVISGIFASIFGIFSGAVASVITFCILLLILIILVCIWIIKFFFGLLKCYASIIFKIIIAPLEIGIGAFPNSKLGFRSWLMDLVANLAVFPISFCLLLLTVNIIITIAGDISLTEILNFVINGTDPPSWNLWAPSLLGGSGSKSFIIAIGSISLSSIMLLSKLPQMIPQFIFSIQPSPWGSAIGKTYQEGIQTITKNPVVGTGKFVAGSSIKKGDSKFGAFSRSVLEHVSPGLADDAADKLMKK